jgi:hypothetical protein
VLQLTDEQHKHLRDEAEWGGVSVVEQIRPLIEKQMEFTAKAEETT